MRHRPKIIYHAHTQNDQYLRSMLGKMVNKLPRGAGEEVEFLGEVPCQDVFAICQTAAKNGWEAEAC